jgi:hypothetical protein
MVQRYPALETRPMIGKTAPLRASDMLFAGLVAVVALAPFAPRLFGGEDIAALVLGFFAAGAGFAALRTLELPVPLARVRVAVALFVALALWISAQALLPLPPGWAPIWDEARSALPALGVVPRLSFNPGATLRALEMLLAAGAAFWLALEFGRSGTRAANAAAVLILAGMVEAVLFLLGFAAAPTLAMPAFLTALALLFERMAGVRSSGRGFGPALAHLLNSLAVEGAALAAALLVLGVALAAAHASIAETGVGAAVLLFGLLAAPSLGIRRRPWLLSIWSVVLLVSLGAVFLGGVPAALRTDGDSVRAAGLALANNPWTGVGLGALDSALPVYREPEMGAFGPVPAVLATTTGAGLPATVAFGVLLLALAGRCAVGVWRRQRQAAYPALTIGLTAAVLLGGPAGLPGLLAWALLLGLGVAQAFPTRGA